MMIAQWMLYGVAVALLLGLGALALERALAAYQLPTRWAWAAALLLSLAVPAAARLLAPEAAPVRTATPVVRTTADPSPADQAPSPAPPPAEAPAPAPSRPRLGLPSLALPQPDLSALDRPLLLAWGASSAVALLALAGLAAVLERRRRGWRTAHVSGVTVLVSPDTGPAVVGLFRSRIVFPEWAYAAEGEVRALMLEHEREHVRARDPLLLTAALALVALAPWSPALWWQLRRLRLAIEFDCDARVLRRRGDVRAYGALLLEVGRRAAGRRLALAAFSEPASFLERRIRRMTAPRERRPWLRAAGFGALAGALGFAACETRGPVAPAPESVERLYAAPGAPEPAAPERLAVRQAVERWFPQVLRRATEGGAFLVFEVDEQGRVTDRHAATRAGLDSMAAMYRADPRSPGTSIQVTPQDRQMDMAQLLSVDLLAARPGVLGPGEVTVLWQRMGAVSRGWEVTMASWGKAPLAGAPVDMEELRRLAHVHLPSAALGEGVDGRVEVEFTVGADGVARNLAVQGSPPAALAEAARRVVAEARFHPDLREGRPVECRASVGINFAAVARQPVWRRAGWSHPLPPLEPIAAAVRRHHPGAAEPEYWFVVDAAGRVLHTGADPYPGPLPTADPAGRALRSNRFPTLDNATIDYGREAHVRVEVDGRFTTVLWIVLKSEAQLRADANRPDSVVVGTLDGARP